jgi:hypothetical protein
MLKRLSRINNVRGLMRRTEIGIGALLFAFLCAVFLLSIVHQIADSQYSMLLSESLLHHRTFSLDHYAIPRYEPKQQIGWVSDGDIYHLEYVQGRLYYFFPPGTSVLSVPYVAVMNLLGVSAANADGSYNPSNELILEKYLAAILMAALGAAVYFTARLHLQRAWSILIALGIALGTQVWSTASRGLWADTWGILLLSVAVWMLVAQETGEHSLRPVWLATVLAWTYFSRPTFAIPIFFITLYILFSVPRREFMRYALTGAAWFALFVIYSLYNFSQLLPNYYRSSRLRFESFTEAMLGNLISPSRGLFIFVPVTLFIAYLLIRYRAELPHRRLVLVGLAVIALHIFVIAGFSPWWGGHCYGPRYTTGLVPWFALLAISGVKASLSWREKHGEATLRRRLEWGAGALLLLCSMFINGKGAMSPRTSRWNTVPVSVDYHPERVWDWRDPQFMR